MSVQTPGELEEALAAGDFDRLKDTKEDEWLDFKSQPYQLQHENQKWELAKDVAAFANTAGGYIVLGVKTEKRATEIGDIAKSYSLIPKSQVDWGKYLDVFKEWIYPLVRGVRATWYPDDGAHPQGLLLIHIPPQHLDEQPFVLRRMLVRENEPPAAALGIPERRGDQVQWMRAEMVHHRLAFYRAGGGGGPTGNRGYAGAHHEERAQRADAQLIALETESEWQGAPTYFLQAYGPAGRRFGQEYQAAAGIRGALERPPSLRHNGFNLDTHGELDVRDGNLAYVGDPRRVLWLERDGLFTAGAIGNEEYLGWAMNRQRATGQPTTINPIVLVEYTLEFFRFLHQVLVPRLPGSWTIRVAGRGWKSRSGGLKLRPGAPQSVMFGVTPGHLASGDALLETFDSTGHAERDAFIALASVYGYFGYGPEKIPYADGDTISEEQVMRL